MPPARRSQAARAPPAIASAFLTNQVWDMKKALQYSELPRGLVSPVN